MKVSVRRSPNRRALPLSLGLSALAFVALAYVETEPAHADDGASLVMDSVDALPTLEHHTLVLADLELQREEAIVERSVATSTVAQAMPTPRVSILVPDVIGMRLPQARRAMRAAGLKLVVRDSGNEPVPRDEARFYNVRRQSSEAGARVEPGAWVRLQVRERGFVAMGY